jgi:preprotein translocase subunit SecG
MGGPMGGGFHQPPPPPGYGRRRRGYYGGGCGSIVAFVILLVVIAVVMITLGIFSGGTSSDITASTYNREKAETGMSFDSNCVVDELGWFDSTSQTGRELKEFYNETGVQPYVLFRAYDSTLTSNEDKEAWAQDYYNNTIGNEGTFLFVYFAEEDTDDDVGYMYCVAGNLVESVMDSQAQEIFWNYVDTYWYSDLSTDDMTVQIFTKTADRIMTKTTTKSDVQKTTVLVIFVIVIAIIAALMLKWKYKRAKEKAQEDERILNTPVHTYSDADGQDLADKYK